MINSTPPSEKAELEKLSELLRLITPDLQWSLLRFSVKPGDILCLRIDSESFKEQAPLDLRFDPSALDAYAHAMIDQIRDALSATFPDGDSSLTALVHFDTLEIGTIDRGLLLSKAQRQ